MIELADAIVMAYAHSEHLPNEIFRLQQKEDIYKEADSHHQLYTTRETDINSTNVEQDNVGTECPKFWLELIN